MTFDDILPPHMITRAPPPSAADADEKKRRRGGRGHSKTASAPERPSPPSISMESPRPPSAKRNYPTGKKPSFGGTGSRMRATALALVRGLSVVKMKQNSRERGGYEAV